MGEKPIKLLLIEDNPGDARLMELMLRGRNRESFELEWVERFTDGLQRVSKGDIDLVLLDLSLPDSHGPETFSKFHLQAPHVPIIVLSGLDDEEVAIKTVHEGAQDYLVKGHVDSHLLVRAVRYAIERKRVQDQLAQYAEELRKKNEQMEADLDMAREIQVVLLPPQSLSFPRNAPPNEVALQFHRRYLPATSLGGDFFDMLELSSTEAGLFICDVMGHGVRSALITAMMRALVEEPSPITADPGKFLAKINHSLLTILRQAEAPTFVSAFYLVADTATGQMRYANAGHPAPFHLHRDTGIVDSLTANGDQTAPALGLFEEAVFPTLQRPLAPRDMLMLFTDGLFEVEGSNKDYYGQQRLLEAVKSRVQQPPAKLFSDLLAEIPKFSVTGGFTDDVCLVAMEVKRIG